MQNLCGANFPAENAEIMHDWKINKVNIHYKLLICEKLFARPFMQLQPYLVLTKLPFSTDPYKSQFSQFSKAFSEFLGDIRGLEVTFRLRSQHTGTLALPCASEVQAALRNVEFRGSEGLDQPREGSIVRQGLVSTRLVPRETWLEGFGGQDVRSLARAAAHIYSRNLIRR